MSMGACMYVSSVCVCLGAGDGQLASTGLMADMRVNKGGSCSVSRLHSVLDLQFLCRASSGT